MAGNAAGGVRAHRLGPEPAHPCRRGSSHEFPGHARLYRRRLRRRRVSGRIGRIGDLEIRRQHLYTLSRRRAAPRSPPPGRRITRSASAGRRSAPMGRSRTWRRRSAVPAARSRGRAGASRTGPTRTATPGSWRTRRRRRSGKRTGAKAPSAEYSPVSGHLRFRPPLADETLAAARGPGPNSDGPGRVASPRAGRRLDACRSGPAAHRHRSTLSRSEEHGIGVHGRATPGSGTCKAHPFSRPEARQESADRPRSPDAARLNCPAGTDMATARYVELETADERKRP